MPQAAVLQMTSAPDVAENLATAANLLQRARDQGAVLAALPENFALMGNHETDKLAIAETQGEGTIQTFLADQARRLQMWIIAGTVPIRVPERSDRVAAASLVFDASGACVARYDKIHLFDVDIPDREERYCESATIAAGDRLVSVDSPLGRIGLGVCYDMRFPELFRALTAEGARVLSLPSAFTAPTGRAHWELLVRTRAVENLCYVLAPAQCGQHRSGRVTYGDSMIVDPWGTVLARAEPGPGVVSAEIDAFHQDQLRTRFPALQHRRLPLAH